MKTFLICERQIQGTCKRVDCNHYHPHEVWFDPDPLGDPAPCSSPVYCSIVDEDVVCKMVREN